jgi:hypothetical protein
MQDMSLGIVILLIATLGYLSNMLNWRYLNYGAIRLLYYIGAFVHETSHAILCIITGAKIEEFTVFSEQPQVIHRKSKLPIIGGALISFAPIAGGLLFLFLINHYLLGSYFTFPQPSSWQDWRVILTEPLELLAQINFFQWQSWVMILLFFNVGAMLGPSLQDLKNVWLVLIILFFIHSSLLAELGFVALSFILVNIVLQAVVIVLLKLARWKS